MVSSVLSNIFVLQNRKKLTILGLNPILRSEVRVKKLYTRCAQVLNIDTVLIDNFDLIQAKKWSMFLC